MSIYPGLFNKIPEDEQPDRYLAPSRQLALLVVLIFLGEMVAMVALYFLQIPNYLLASLVDGWIMVALIIPALYLLQLNPLVKHIEGRNRTETALRRSEELFRNVLAQLPVGVWITDRSGEILHGNPASQQIWGGARYVGVEQYGEYKGWWADSGKPVAPDEWAAVRVISRGETVLNEEINIEAFDGARKTILNSAVPILDEQNAIQGAVIVNQDITSLKEAQHALEESEQLFRTAMENLPVGVWLTDGTGNIIYGNSAGQSIWAGARYVGKEHYGEYKAWWLSTGQRIEPEDWAVARAIDKGETSLNEEIEIECFDGTHKYILNSAIPVFDDLGGPLWAFVVNQDITERKQRERALVQTNELLERYFSSISTLIAYMDREFNFIRVNEAYASSAGHAVEYFIGKNHFELYPHEENQEIFRRVMETGEAYSVLEKPFEYPEYPDRGTTYWDWSVQPVKEADGSVQGVVLSLVDVTERKRAEQQLERQNQVLQELSQAEHRQRELAESLVKSAIALNSSLDLQDVLNTILEQIRRSIPFQEASIAMLDGGNISVASNLSSEDHPSDTSVMGATYSIAEFPYFRKMCSSLQPVCVADTQVDPHWRVISGLEWVRSYLAAPLVIEDRVIGILNLSSDQPGSFDATNVEHLVAFCSHAALALHNARLYQAQLTARQNAETLSAASTALTHILDVDHVLQTLLEHVHILIPCDTSGIGLLEGETKLSVRSIDGVEQWDNPSQVLSAVMDIGASPVLKKLIFTHQSMLADYATVPRRRELVDGAAAFHSWLGVPIVADGKVIGVLGLGKREAGYYNQEHIQWAEALVSQAAVAIQNAWLFEQVRAGKERLQFLSRRLVEVQEGERRYIARELHDDSSQALTSIMVDLQVLVQGIHDSDLVLKVMGIQNCLKDVLDNLHRLAMDLRPATLDHLGLEATLRNSAANIQEKHGLQVKIKLTGIEKRLPDSLETNLYRIVQEGLNNIIRHANATMVDVVLSTRGDKLILIIEDDGDGFNPQSLPQTGRLGLFGIQERAEMLGGNLVIESEPGKGTTLVVEVPYVD